MSRVAQQNPQKPWHAVPRTIPFAVLLAVVSCGEESQSPTMPVPSKAPAEIVDGARQGNPHFFFLPPLVPQPFVTGVVDPNVGPNVVICEWDTSVPGGKCGALIAQFAREVNTVDQALIDVPGQVRFNGNHYYAFWNTQECITGPCQLDPIKKYRIRVLVGLTELGHADVNLVEGQNALKNIDTNEYIGLVDGKKLPLKFRIELGAVDVVAPGKPAMIGNVGGDVSTTDGEVSLKIPSNALATETPITVEKVTEERPQTGEWSDVVELGPDGTTFTYPVTLTLSYDVTKLPPGVPPEALKVSTWVSDHWEEVPGSTLNLDNSTISAPITHFSSYSLAIWPNAVQGAPGPQQLYVGQSTTLGSMSWYYQTVPYQQCYTNAIWVSRWYGGFWRYQTQCYTYTQVYSYPMSGYVSWSSQNAAILGVAAPGYSIANYNGQSISPLISAVGPGTANITAQFGNARSSVSFSVQPPVVSINVQPNPAGVKPGQTVQLTATALDGASQPVAGVAFTWQSSNTSIATVDANGLVSGLTNGNVTVTATSAGVSGSTTVKVGTPSISPSPGSVTIQVNQGGSKSAQITINNGGGGVLTGLQAGPFSNYFNGSPAPWVTATFNTTTAPAIMTITAAPGLEIPAGVHQLRFDVFAPGVNAYTFYSINITVVDKDIILVNATIAPSPGSVGISVPAGSTRTAQITINNSGTDPLTQLTAGPFSNYFNGSPAPWVNATFNTTTAPAILTITASPPLNTPQGLHALRFDVMSPGATNSPYTFYSIPVTVTAPEIPPFLAGGGKSTCALKPDQTVLCWGEASNGATTPSSGTFSTIGGGFFHYCGIRPDRSLNCWGYNSDLRATPPTTGLYYRISVGPEHNCALRTDDTAICWGFGGDGRSSPLPGTYKMIGVGWYHSCAVRTNDTVACWGQNGAGQSNAPVGTFKVVGGGPSFSCGIRTDDTLECWGTGIPAPPGGTFRQLATATAGGHACAIRSDDTLVCWGQNDHGQANAPSGQFIQVVTNYLQSCAVRASRAVVCWGSGATGATSVPALLANP